MLYKINSPVKVVANLFAIKSRFSYGQSSVEIKLFRLEILELLRCIRILEMLEFAFYVVKTIDKALYNVYVEKNILLLTKQTFFLQARYY